MGKVIKFILLLCASVLLFIGAGSIIPLIAGYSIREILNAFLIILIVTSFLGLVALLLAFILWDREDYYG